MGRQQKRDFVKHTAKKGINKDVAEFYWNARTYGSAPVELNEGDHVKINIEAIKKHPDYNRLSETYREFVETHAANVFTVVYDERHKRNPTIVTLAEDPFGWLFWTGNLIKVDD